MDPRLASRAFAFAMLHGFTPFLEEVHNILEGKQYLRELKDDEEPKDPEDVLDSVQEAILNGDLDIAIQQIESYFINKETNKENPS